MPRKKGEPKTGGRKKGTPNKVTASMRDAFLEAFDIHGGVQAIAKWANTNETDFFKLCARLIPSGHELSVPDPDPDDEPIDYEDMARRILFMLDDCTRKAVKQKAEKAAEQGAVKEDVIAGNVEELEIPPSKPPLAWVDPNE